MPVAPVVPSDLYPFLAAEVPADFIALASISLSRWLPNVSAATLWVAVVAGCFGRSGCFTVGVGMGRLRLEVRDFGGPLRWRWLLTDEDTGVPRADHQVDLAGVPGEFAAFGDLYRYLRWNAVPDRRAVE